MKGAGKKVAPKKKANGYKMPPPIKEGEVIEDALWKQKWKIGPSIGTGGFGEIYSACNGSSPKKEYSYVIKVEPHENGPLFVEKNFYLKNCKKEDIESFKKEKKLSSLGMPISYGCGSHNYNGEKYRYLVLERYDRDLLSVFTENGSSFPAVTVFQIGIQMLDVLEYIHSRGYVHADIKAANILMGRKKGTENQVYLVDFGLATRVSDGPFKPDPKCAHNGTLEFTSRDAHSGEATYRGDLEILAYNMLQWLVGELPWDEKTLKKCTPVLVQQMKNKFMEDARSSITTKYSDVPDQLIKYFEYINTLKPKEKPDYTKCRKLFESYLKAQGKALNGKLDFKLGKTNKANERESNKVKSKSSEKKLKNNKVSTVQKPKRVAAVPVEDVDVVDAVDDEDIKEVKKTPKRKSSEALEESSKKQKVKKTKLTKQKVKQKKSETENGENNDPDVSVELIPRRIIRKERKSLEPNLVVSSKKVKMVPKAKATPPTKVNHANIATQTSTDKKKPNPRIVSFDSPISEVIGEKNVSADIFDDTFEEQPKRKQKKRLLSDEEWTEKRVVKKKDTIVRSSKRKVSPLKNK